MKENHYLRDQICLSRFWSDFRQPGSGSEVRGKQAGRRAGGQKASRPADRPPGSPEMSLRLRVCVFSYNKKCLRLGRNLTGDCSKNGGVARRFPSLSSPSLLSISPPAQTHRLDRQALLSTTTITIALHCIEGLFRYRRFPTTAERSRGCCFMSPYLPQRRLSFSILSC